MRLKNGLPWSSIQNTGIKASNELISKALEVFHSTDWENHRRNVEQTAIYPDTRTRPYISILDAPEKYKNTVSRSVKYLLHPTEYSDI